jgi:TatD DNase family protein
MLIDIHCHVDFYPEEKIKKMVAECKKKKVIFVNQGTRPGSLEKVVKLNEDYPEIAKIALGIYPLDALKLSDKELEERINFIGKNAGKIVAIGEVGMDFHEEKTNDEKSRKKQEENFIKFIKLAKELSKPIIVHSRKAEKECIDILEREKAKKVIMHCFNGNFKLVQRIIDNGWSLTIPTSVTRSEHFQKIIEITPIEQLFCETDSPYLHPDKTKRDNTPANVEFGYKAIARIKKLPLKEVELALKDNFDNLFQVK